VFRDSVCYGFLVEGRWLNLSPQPPKYTTNKTIYIYIYNIYICTRIFGPRFAPPRFFLEQEFPTTPHHPPSPPHPAPLPLREVGWKKCEPTSHHTWVGEFVNKTPTTHPACPCPCPPNIQNKLHCTWLPLFAQI
jgi:hypothetical protein